jgi:hypothetical protein
MASASANVLHTRKRTQAAPNRRASRERTDARPNVTAHRAAVYQPRAARKAPARGPLVLLALLFTAELLWLAVIAYLLYRFIGF